eukprot:TRINITY_DN1913_c0_g2_i1.p1 TRINITY_DN1913_c0_g2~~TRINITY_DN1913_c0_g2_i1.p1  ORF type:complete len:211 (-),score=36.97 TRINITY_DN1913_c0_g2_i1:360-992(-)
MTMELLSQSLCTVLILKFIDSYSSRLNSGEIMKIHHQKHHNAYVTNLNAALDKYSSAVARNDIAEQIALQGAIRFNGGGHVNHSIFWTNLAPKKEGGGQPPSGPLAEAINKGLLTTFVRIVFKSRTPNVSQEFGSLDKFISQFNTASAAVQGSGWGWLVYNKATGRVQITTRPNQGKTNDYLSLVSRTNTNWQIERPRLYRTQPRSSSWN